jgi:DNA invertase Pin-like site-specific DNA recombinase
VSLQLVASLQIVAYLRVSTVRQGESGLGLEAQRAAVASYAKAQGATILREFVEVESGKKSDRPQLKAALAHARRSKARLVVAKLDRLSRNVAFLSAIMEAGVEFSACDVPSASRVVLHILAAIAEEEARAISVRTKAALAAAKARGTLLGTNRPGSVKVSTEARKLGQARGSRANREKAIAGYADLLPYVSQLRSQGVTLVGIASVLNAEGHVTRNGAAWSPAQIHRLLARAA